MTETQISLIKVLQRIIHQVSIDDRDADIYADALDYMLDDLRSNDFFGTEGQCDPRGDQRFGEFTVWEVEE
jgi:hypothetical protein